MKSKAHIKSHPLHPILIPFPIAFFTGAFVFDTLALVNESGNLWQTGYYLEIAGVFTSLVAAIPGIIDYLFTVPPNSSAKARAGKHGFLNVTTLIIFSIALAIRNKTDFSFWVIGLEMAGVALLCIAGWMGGTLVHRNQIGIDVRYAEAGKWSEMKITEVAEPIEVAASDELKIGQMKLLRLKDRRIVLGRSETGYVAFDDRCTHKGGSLAGGALICGTVQCPWHGSQFDTVNGMVKAGPAKEKINSYLVWEDRGKIFLTLPTQ